MGAVAGFAVEQTMPVPVALGDDDWQPLEESPDPGPGATNTALIEIRTALEIFYLESGGRYPGDLATLSEPTENFPRGTLDGQPIPNDGWGNAFAYTAKADGAGYTLWSFGANGVDEGAAGTTWPWTRTDRNG